MEYKPESEADLKKKYQEGKSAIRWLILAVIFMVAAGVSQIVWFIWILTENPNTKAAFIAMVGLFILAEYCRWCAKDSKPESWK